MVEEKCDISMEELAWRPWRMELGLVQKKRALVNSNKFCRLTRSSVANKDDANLLMLSDTSMETFFCNLCE